MEESSYVIVIITPRAVGYIPGFKSEASAETAAGQIRKDNECRLNVSVTVVRQ